MDILKEIKENASEITLYLQIVIYTLGAATFLVICILVVFFDAIMGG